MIRWVGFMGKLLELVLSKLVGKKIEMRLDTKKQAAQAFLRLHDALGLLEVATTRFLEETGAVAAGEKPRLFSVPVNEVVREADIASKKFVQALKSLCPVIAIYDQNLAKLLLGVYGFKRAMVTSGFSELMTFQTRVNPDSVFFIESSAPMSEAAGQDLQKAYQQVAAIELRRFGGWPKDTLRSIVEKQLVQDRIADDDLDRIKELHKVLSAHLGILSTARLQLADFLREHFSLEDLLYVS